MMLTNTQLIVPDGLQTVPQDYQFLVLDKAHLWNNTALRDETPFKDLHGRRLRFQPGNVSALGHDAFTSGTC
jgi:hypothetical protein